MEVEQETSTSATNLKLLKHLPHHLVLSSIHRKEAQTGHSRQKVIQTRRERAPEVHHQNNQEKIILERKSDFQGANLKSRYPHHHQNKESVITKVNHRKVRVEEELTKLGVDLQSVQVKRMSQIHKSCRSLHRQASKSRCKKLDAKRGEAASVVDLQK